jgi:hypothetical protein
MWGIVASALLAALAGWFLGRASSRPDAPPAVQAAQHRESAPPPSTLEAALERNRQLSAEVDWLQAQLDVLASRHAATGEEARADAALHSLADAGHQAADKSPDGAENGVEPGSEAASAEAGEEPEDGWFDDAALAQAGLLPYEIDRIRDIFDASEMAAIGLEHQARREGWYGSPRYKQALYDQRTDLRANIGEEDFDLLLYASGRENRVVIDGLLRGSPGDRAGLQQGDVVLSYEGRRIFKAPELKRATVQGKAGDIVPIVVVRNGEVMRVYAERGPLGVRLRPDARLPEVQ